MNIHKRMSEQIGLAKIYAKDGAFHTAARILRNLSDEVGAHAANCDDHLKTILQPRDPRQAEAIFGDPINLQGSGPGTIEPRKG